MKRAAAVLIFPRYVYPFSRAQSIPTSEGEREKERKTDRERNLYNLILQCSLFLRNHRCVTDLPQLISVIANLIYYYLIEQKITE